MYEKVPCIHISIEQNVNLGNFQSAKVSMTLTNVPFEADEEEIARGMGTAQIAFTQMKAAMRAKIAVIRKEGGFDPVTDDEPEPAYQRFGGLK